MTTQTICLKSNDGGEIFVVNVQAAQKSVALKTMMEDPYMLKKGDNVISVPILTNKVLKKVIEWLEHHRDDSEQNENGEDDTQTDEISAWDVEFFKVNEDIIYDIMTAADFMEIPSLLSCSCKAIAKINR